MPMEKPKTLQNQAIEKLKSSYGEREATNIVNLLLEHICGIDRMKLALNQDIEINGLQSTAIEQAIAQLLAQVPVQHIIGEVEFYGCRIKTDERALIPRPETEELVDWICKENELDAPNILDIGTGSGCIPVALKKSIPLAKVSAVDISKEALKLAELNANLNKVEIHFRQMDILKDAFTFEGLDIIVSNPPYIPSLEKEYISANVTQYEPSLALFVPDDDPLLFYNTIGEHAIRNLNIGGMLYFEIHENFGEMLVTLMEDIGFTNVTLKKDLQGKDRMLQAQKFYR